MCQRKVILYLFNSKGYLPKRCVQNYLFRTTLATLLYYYPNYVPSDEKKRQNQSSLVTFYVLVVTLGGLIYDISEL